MAAAVAERTGERSDVNIETPHHRVEFYSLYPLFIANKRSAADWTAEDVRPGGPYIDPRTNASLTTLKLPAQSGAVLLRHWTL